jgi:hypothetical protein
METSLSFCHIDVSHIAAGFMKVESEGENLVVVGKLLNHYVAIWCWFEVSCPRIENYIGNGNNALINAQSRIH